MKKEKIINFKKYEDFKKDLEAGELLDTSIIFIDDLPGIYTHGTLFYCSSKPIIPGELAPDPEEPEEPQIFTVTFEFDEGIKDIDLYGKTITKNKITFSGETVEIEEGENLTWMANLNEGYDYGTNCNGNKQIDQSQTISMSSKEKWDEKYAVTAYFDEGVEYVSLEWSSYTQRAEIRTSGESYRIPRNNTITWAAKIKDGYEAVGNWHGTVLNNKDVEVRVETQWVGIEEPDPTPEGNFENNQIVYKTRDNRIIDVSTLAWGNTIQSNVYDPENDYCIITFANDVTYLPDKFFNTNDWISNIIWIPSTVTRIGAQVFKNLGYMTGQFAGYLDFSNIEEVEIGEQFCYAIPKTCNYINAPKKITKVGKDYLAACNGLIELNTNSFNGITEIGTGFYSYCTKLETVDLSGLKDVETVGSDLLARCSALKTIIIDSPDKALTKVLNAINTTYLTNLAEIYVNDDLVEEYKSNVSKFSGMFKPLSEY